MFFDEEGSKSDLPDTSTQDDINQLRARLDNLHLAIAASTSFDKSSELDLSH